MAFTFAAFCYMLSLVLCAALIFFAIWHVSNLQRLLTLMYPKGAPHAHLISSFYPPFRHCSRGRAVRPGRSTCWADLVHFPCPGAGGTVLGILRPGGTAPGAYQRRLKPVASGASLRGTFLGVAMCPTRARSSGSKPHLPGFRPPPPFSPAGRREEALPVSQAISQVTITTKHLKCQHLWWVAFRHNWRQSGNTTRAPCKRKQGEARQEGREIKRDGSEERRGREEDQGK